MSWRTILKFMDEFDSDGWVSAQDFSEIFYIQIKKVYYHLKNLVAWGYVKRRKRPHSGQKGFEYEHQITFKGIRKLDYISKLEDLENAYKEY